MCIHSHPLGQNNNIKTKKTIPIHSSHTTETTVGLFDSSKAVRDEDFYLCNYDWNQSSKKLALADLGDLCHVAGLVEEDADALVVEFSGHEGAVGQSNHLDVPAVGQNLVLGHLGRQPLHLRPRRLLAAIAHGR